MNLFAGKLYPSENNVMNPSAVTIQIPKPCHERWEAMTHEEKGRFCQVCSKTVVDFSRYSRAEIIDHVLNTKASVCGRIPVNMLTRTIGYSVTDVQKRTLGKFALALLLVFGNFLFVYGQHSENRLGKVLLQPEPQVQTIDTLSLQDTLKTGCTLPVTDTTIVPDVEEPMIMGMIYLPPPPVIEKNGEGDRVRGGIIQDPWKEEEE